MAVNKVVINGQTKIDLSSDTAAVDKVLSGYTFHDHAGVQQTGTYDPSEAWVAIIGLTTKNTGLYGQTINITKTSGTPDGSSVIPANNIQTWLLCAGITNKDYTTIDQVLADSTTYAALLSSNNACNYLVRSTSWVDAIASDSDAMTELGQHDYACNTLLANYIWAYTIANSTYFESVLNAKVPTMTSDTTPSGTASAINQYSASYAAWKAFDNNDSTAWIGSTGSAASYSNRWIGYAFTNPLTIKRMYVKFDAYTTSASYKVQAYDGTNWVDISDVNTSLDGYTFVNSKSQRYSQYRLFIVSQTVTSSSYYSGRVSTLQFYGRYESSE